MAAAMGVETDRGYLVGAEGVGILGLVSAACGIECGDSDDTDYSRDG